MKSIINYYNPIDMINDLFSLPDEINHISYDENISPEYTIIRSCSHNGIIYFTYQTIIDALDAIVNMKSCYKKTVPCDLSKIKSIKYTVGRIELESFFVDKELETKDIINNQTDIVKIPVRCEYVF